MSDAPIKICEYCGKSGQGFYTWMNGETTCRDCFNTLPIDSRVARHVILKLRAELAKREESEPVAYMYEYDGMVHGKIYPAPLVHPFDRWSLVKSVELWTETPLYAHPPRQSVKPVPVAWIGTCADGSQYLSWRNTTLREEKKPLGIIATPVEVPDDLLERIDNCFCRLNDGPERDLVKECRRIISELVETKI